MLAMFPTKQTFGQTSGTTEGQQAQRSLANTLSIPPKATSLMYVASPRSSTGLCCLVRMHATRSCHIAKLKVALP